VVLYRQERRRCQGDLPDLVGLCCLLGRDLRRDRVRRFDRVDRVGHLLQLDRHRRASMACLERGYLLVLSLRLCQGRRGLRWGQGGRVGRFLRLCLDRRGYQRDRVHQVRQVDRPGRVDQVGMVCMAVVALPSKFPMVGDRERRVLREHQVCLAFRSFLDVLVDQEDQASSSCRNQPASWRSFGCAQRGQW